MKISRWFSLVLALALAAALAGCSAEIYGGYPGPHRVYVPRDRPYHGGDVEGTVVRVSHRDQVIVVVPRDTADRDDDDRDSDDRYERRRGPGRGGEIALFYDDDTKVEYQGRDYRPEDLERGDRIHANVERHGGRLFAGDVQVLYDVSSGAPDEPGDRGDDQGANQGDDQRDDQGELHGTVRNVDPERHTLEIEVTDGHGSADGRSGVVRMHYDDQTSVEYEGRNYEPENLEPGDVVNVELSHDRGGRPVAGHIVVVKNSRGATSP
ncbi:MAG TPA: hypothetical protein VF173_00830 [Thermoanaerobaculia bacterium]|nr:hypothetical protein [Thermoanaerobaculia bacterium]